MDYKKLETSELFEVFVHVSNEILKRKNETDEKMRFANYHLDSISHEIESTSFNAAEGYKYAKIFQKMRMYRRMMKNEKYYMNAFMSCFDKRSVSSLKAVTKVIGKITQDDNKDWCNYGKLGRPDYAEFQKSFDLEKKNKK